jgi:hypothetical protein
MFIMDASRAWRASAIWRWVSGEWPVEGECEEGIVGEGWEGCEDDDDGRVGEREGGAGTALEVEASADMVRELLEGCRKRCWIGVFAECRCVLRPDLNIRCDALLNYTLPLWFWLRCVGRSEGSKA